MFLDEVVDARWRLCRAETANDVRKKQIGMNLDGELSRRRQVQKT